MTIPLAMPGPETINAWARLVRVSRQLVDAVEEQLKAAGLPALAWYDVLHELAEAGEGGLRPFQLTERILLQQYNVSRLLARLEANGLIEKLMVESDGRGQTVRITPAGREMRRRIWAVYGLAIASLFEDKLSEDEVGMLTAILGKLRAPVSSKA
ncbi:MarR family winged helix-turn-helix transcriptional regulator [Mesorhizobium sp. ANAO-SY3R2]